MKSNESQKEVIMSLLNLLSGQLLSEAIDKISSKLGIEKSTVSIVVSAAVPLIIKALAKNTQDESGAESLQNALERDHDGSVLDDVGGFLEGFDTAGGTGILTHVLGGQKGTVEQGLAQMSGLDSSQTGSILSMLAPIVIGAVSKKKQEEGADAAGLSEMLRNEEKEVEQREPGAAGLLEKLLDTDGDGDISGEAVDLGAKLIKGFLG